MAQRPTTEETAARHRAKLAQHPFVEVPGSKLCGHGVAVFDPMRLTASIAGAMTGYSGPDYGLEPERRRCNRPRRAHITD